MGAKVLLVSSSFEGISLITASLNRKDGIKTTDESHYPLGMAYIHSYLESHGNQVESLSLNNCDFKTCFRKVRETIHEYLPEIIGFQLLSANRVSTYRLIEDIHESHPHIHLVIGGIHATAMYEQLIMRYPFLIAVLGEGEETFSELIEKVDYETKRDLLSICGIAFYENGSVVSTRPRRLIDNLDMLPFPKHEAYFDNKRTTGCIITTRGCPFKCSFCALKLITRRKVRKRSVSNVIGEIEWMIRKFPQMKQIWIHDDSFFIDNGRVIELCEEILRRKIKIEFICSGRVKPLSKEVVNKLEQANFKKVLFGLESGSARILKTTHKKISKRDVIKAVRLFSDSRIDIKLFLIVGLPGETNQTILETGEFIKRIQRIKYIHYSGNSSAILSVYPNTEIYEMAKGGGIIDDSFWLSDEPVPAFTLENDLEQLFRLKESLLDHISASRLFTISGFKNQWLMLPYIVRNKQAMVAAVQQLLRSSLPNRIFRLLQRTFIKYGIKN